MKLNYKNLLFFGALISLLSFPAFSHWGTRGTFGGTVTCSITTDTAIFVGTAKGGVFRSTNSRLQRWTAMPVGLTSGNISALAHTGKYLFAATADSGIFIYTGFKGNDRYWIRKNSGLSNLKITSLVALDSITLMAGTSGGGIFKTTNKGETWLAVNNSILHHLEISNLVKAGNRVIHTALDGGIYASDNKGDSWIDLNDPQTEDITATSISYNAVTDEILVFAGSTLYKTGTASTVLTPGYSVSGNGLPFGVVIRSISNDGANWYLATDKGVYSSPSSSINWTNISTGLKTLDVNSIVPFKSTLVAGTNKEGIFKASLPFSSWVGYDQYFTNIETFSHATGGANLTIEATEKGVFLNKNLDTTHTRINKGLTDSLNVNDVMMAGTYLFAATKNAGIFSSLDTGKTWTAINSGLPSLDFKKLFFSNGTKYAFSADGKIYSSLLASPQWSSEQFDLPLKLKPSSLTFFGNKIILSTIGNGMFVKIDNTSNWTEINTGLTNLNVTSTATLNGKVFAGTSGSGVFVSDTSLFNWAATTPITGSYTETIGLNGQFVQALGTNAGYLLASYKGGVMASSDNGFTWVENLTQFNLPSYADINKITFTTGTASRAFISTPGNSIYSNAISELPPVTGLTDAFISDTGNKMLIVPNPNSGTFKLSFAENVSDIKILNQNGTEVASQNLSTDHMVNVNLPSGIYFIKANKLNAVVVKKLMIK